MNWLERHPAVGALALITLALLAHRMAYNDEVAASKTEIRYVEKPFTNCRLPDVNDEYRVILQYRTEPDVLLESCSIEPRDREEGPSATMQRLLNRKRVES